MDFIMIKDLYIENFKCFNKIKIDDIKKINFLVGKNNSGKTTILEALMLILSESRINVIENIKTISRFKENKTEIKTLFYNFDYNNNINFNYNKYDNTSYNINISPVLKDNKIPKDDNIELNYNTIINNDDSIEEKKLNIPNNNVEIKKAILVLKVEFLAHTKSKVNMGANIAQSQKRLIKIIAMVNMVFSTLFFVLVSPHISKKHKQSVKSIFSP